MKDVTFEKKGFTFHFRNPKLDKYNKLVTEYKIDGIKENSKNDGFFLNAEFSESKKAIVFSAPLVINGSEIGGVGLNDELFATYSRFKSELLKEMQDKINKVVDSIIAGETPISFILVRGDFSHYEATLKNLPKEIQSNWYHILDTAVKKYTQGELFFLNGCDFLRKQLNLSPCTAEGMRKEATDFKFAGDEDNYRDFREGVIVEFKMKLSDLISLEFIHKKIEEKRMSEEARKAMDVVVLRKYRQEDDVVAVVSIKDASTKEELEFICKNIFDFGYVINPNYSLTETVSNAALINNQWQTVTEGTGWNTVRDLTSFEKKCIEYLTKYPPISNEIRM